MSKIDPPSTGPAQGNHSPVEEQEVAAVLRRPVCELLGCQLPLALAGMGGVARSALVGAVTEAGGFGFLGMVREPVALIREEVRRVRARTDRRFGVSLIPAATEPALLDAQVATCIELRVPVMGLFWDLSAALVRRLREAGVTVACQVGSLQEAIDAQDAGAQLLIVQGLEAGGHVRGQQPLSALLPQVVARARVPVLAAGGLADGAGVAAAMGQGAQGALLGTALIPTHESFAHAFHQRAIVAAGPDATVLTEAFHINWPPGARVRVLRNSVTRGEHGNPFDGRRAVIGDEEGRPIYLFSTDSPLRSMTGNFEAMALYAGQGAERITDITGAGERLRRIAADAAAVLRAQGGLLAALNELLEAERAGARITLESLRQTEVPDLQRLLTHVHHDEVRWCGLLMDAIRGLGGTPSTRTGVFYAKAMAVPDMLERLALLNRGQRWVVRKLRDALTRVDDARVRAGLQDMLASHEGNVERVDARLAGHENTPLP